MRFIKGLTIVLIMLGLLSCAKRPPGVEPPEVCEEAPRGKLKVFVVAAIKHPFAEQFLNSFNKKILSKWWDLLESIKEEYPKTPMAISISGGMVKEFTLLNKNEPQLDPLITLDPEKLDLKQINYLKDRYNVSETTHSLLYWQIQEALSYLGNNLKDDPLVLNIIEKSTYTLKDKDKLIDFLKTKIKDFDLLLKSVLNIKNIEEAVTTLSNAHIGLLDRERIKVQILESMVNYKMWREKFPEGFIPKGGYLNSEAIQQLGKTNIKWVTVQSTTTKNNVRTDPQVLYVDDYFCNFYSSSSFRSYVYNNLDKEKAPHVLIVDFDDIDLLLSDRYLYFIGYEEFVKMVFGKSEDEDIVKLGTTTFSAVPVDFSAGLLKIRNILVDVREVVYKYRNSGRAKLDILIDVHNHLLVAEAGEIYENLDNSIYDRVFRKSVIDIYRNVGISPPIELFVPVIEPKPYRPDEEMTSIVKVNCDGRIEPGEWEGALKVKTGMGNITEMYCGFDEENIYYMMKMSSATGVDEVSTAGVYIGHMDVGRASLAPRNYDVSVANIQDYPIYLDINWRKDVPSKTVIYRTTGDESWEALTGNYDVGYTSGTGIGILEFTVPFKYLDVRPRKNIFYKIYANEKVFPVNDCFAVTVPDFKLSRGIISFIDPVGDIHGPGNYRHPELIEDFKGSLDLRKIVVDEKYGERVITVEFSALDNPYSAPFGFSLPIIDIYVDINKRPGLGRTALLDGRKAYTVSEDAWEYCISISGWEKAVYNTAGRKIGEPQISVSPLDKTINIFVPEELISASIENWGVIPVVMASDEEGRLIKVKADKGDNLDEFRGRKIESDTNIIDVIVPSGSRQKDILGANRRGRAIELPALRKQ